MNVYGPTSGVGMINVGIEDCIMHTGNIFVRQAAEKGLGEIGLLAYS